MLFQERATLSQEKAQLETNYLAQERRDVN